MKGKKVLSLSMAALLAASMVPATAVSADSKDERTIKVLTIWNENVQGGTQTLKKLSDEYCEQHSEIKVDIEVVAQTDMNSKLSVLAASNELPDLFIEVDTAQANTFITQGLVKNVDEFLADNGLQDILSESTQLGLMIFISYQPSRILKDSGITKRCLKRMAGKFRQPWMNL